MNDETTRPLSATSQIHSIRCACRGIAVAVRSERNLQLHCAALLLVLILGTTLKIDRLEWAIVLLVCGLVFAAEFLNTAIEEIVNVVRPEFDDTAGRIKDVSAAGVLFAAGTSIAVGLLVFGPRLWSLMNVN